MTSDEIRAATFEADTDIWECARWLQEIAAQLADINDQLGDVIASANDDHNAGLRIREIQEPVTRKAW